MDDIQNVSARTVHGEVTF